MSKPGSTPIPRRATGWRRWPSRRIWCASAYADIVNEPVPDRLIAAARGERGRDREAEILVVERRAGRECCRTGAGRSALPPRPGCSASLFGGAGTYFGTGARAR